MRSRNRLRETMLLETASLLQCYPQLQLPIQQGMSKSDIYRDTVLCGEANPAPQPFLFTNWDMLELVDTPAGSIRVLYLSCRESFEQAVRLLAYRCEPVAVPASMGASYINGLINWKTIRDHMNAYATEGHLDADEEFARFTSVRSNYRDALILLSSGPYSAVPAEAVGFAPEVWQRYSVTIRKYHELTHFVCRSLWPDHVNALRDEVLADAIGLLAAFGTYDAALAKRFFGLEGAIYRKGGRLENYGEPETVAEKVRSAIDNLAQQHLTTSVENVFSILKQLENAEWAMPWDEAFA